MKNKIGKTELRITRDEILSLDTVKSAIRCPLCNEMHKIDDPQEVAKESLYCDTYKRRVPFPEDVLDKYKRLTTMKYDDLTPEEKAEARRGQDGRLTWTLRFGK